jgi:hypothetical protein
MPEIANLKVGKPDTTPSSPSHVPGIRQGNQTGSTKKMPGLQITGRRDRGTDRRVMGRGTARRSTGINPSKRNPIDPSMPNLSPA